MLIKNDIKTYDDFQGMTKDSVAALDGVINRANTKLKEVHAIWLNEILSYISFIKTSDEKLEENPTQWDISVFRKWQQDGRPTDFTVQPGNLSPTTNATTASQEKQ